MKIRIHHQISALIVFAAFGAGCSSSGSGGSPPPPPPPPATETVSYSFADFDRIEVDGSFVATVSQSNDFLIEVTIDSSEVSKLDVSSDGSGLHIGFLPGSDVRADIQRATVRMPELTGVKLRGSNDVDVSGFDAGNLAIEIDGNNAATFRDGALDYVTATVSGSSLLDLVNVAAVPGAHFDVSGSSTTMVNLADFANVTGSLSGTASLHYYGSSINFDMNIASTADLTRLGSSR